MAINTDVMRSLLDNFDEHNRDVQEIMNVTPRIVKAYIETLLGYEEIRKKWKLSVDENTELSTKISELQKDLQYQMKQYQDAQFAITQGRILLDDEKKKRKIVENDRDFFEAQVAQLSEILKENINKLSRETKEQLAILRKNRPSLDVLDDRLGTLTEFETTGSVISDLSYTRDEDDLNLSTPDSRGGKRRAGGHCRKGRKKRRSASAMRFNEMVNKSDRVVATTTVTVDGSNIHATAVIESKPDSKNQENRHQPSAPSHEYEDERNRQLISGPSLDDVRSPLVSNYINTRTHNFQQKASLKSEICNVCDKKIRFSALCLKCRDCKTICHAVCKDKAPLPCVGNGTTPGKSCSGLISDYTPIVPPMVPAIVVHCINEVEARGLSEIGIYRIPGSEREVRLLVEKFKRGKGLPNLSQILDIHIICSTLKDFLRSLKDSLSTRQRWNDFAKAIDEENEEERKQKLYKLVNGLPQPNRDTLAFLVLHLQRVAEIPQCKMPLRNLANIFGPTVIGYSSNNIDSVLNETQIGNRIMEELLNLSTEFWEAYLKETDTGRPLRKTPSDFFSTPNQRMRILKRIKNFENLETP